MFRLIILYRTQTRIQKNTEKLKVANDNNKDIGELRDQGFTKPSVLIIAPFRNSAYEIVDAIIKISGTVSQENKNRFKSEFFSEDIVEDFEASIRNDKPGKIIINPYGFF